MHKPAFFYVTYIATTPAALWEALTSPQQTVRYWFGYHFEGEWQVGARLVNRQPDGRVGDFIEVRVHEPPRRLSYSFQPRHTEALRREPPSRVTFDLEPDGDVVKLTLTHDHFEEDSLAYAGICAGWPKILASLKSLLETGTPLSITDSSRAQAEMQRNMHTTAPDPF